MRSQAPLFHPLLLLLLPLLNLCAFWLPTFAFHSQAEVVVLVTNSSKAEDNSRVTPLHMADTDDTAAVKTMPR